MPIASIELHISACDRRARLFEVPDWHLKTGSGQQTISSPSLQNMGDRIATILRSLKRVGLSLRTADRSDLPGLR